MYTAENILYELENQENKKKIELFLQILKESEANQSIANLSLSYLESITACFNKLKYNFSDYNIYKRIFNCIIHIIFLAFNTDINIYFELLKIKEKIEKIISIDYYKIQQPIYIDTMYEINKKTLEAFSQNIFEVENLIETYKLNNIENTPGLYDLFDNLLKKELNNINSLKMFPHILEKFIKSNEKFCHLKNISEQLYFIFLYDFTNPDKFINYLLNCKNYLTIEHKKKIIEQFIDFLSHTKNQLLINKKTFDLLKWFIKFSLEKIQE